MARNILLVEDDESVLGLMAAILAKNGHNVHKATDVPKAREIWSEPGSSFDLLIADVRLPNEEDGFAMATNFLKDHPDVPVIFVSGDRDCFSCPSMVHFGDSPFIAKPFDSKQMVSAVNRVLTGAIKN